MFLCPKQTFSLFSFNQYFSFSIPPTPLSSLSSPYLLHPHLYFSFSLTSTPSTPSILPSLPYPYSHHHSYILIFSLPSFPLSLSPPCPERWCVWWGWCWVWTTPSRHHNWVRTPTSTPPPTAAPGTSRWWWRCRGRRGERWGRNDTPRSPGYSTPTTNPRTSDERRLYAVLLLYCTFVGSRKRGLEKLYIYYSCKSPTRGWWKRRSKTIWIYKNRNIEGKENANF